MVKTVKECALLFGISIEEFLARLRSAKRYKVNEKSTIDDKDIGALAVHERSGAGRKYAASGDALELAYCEALVRDSQ